MKPSNVTAPAIEALYLAILVDDYCNILLGEPAPVDIDLPTSEGTTLTIPAGRKLTRELINKIAAAGEDFEMKPSPFRAAVSNAYWNWSENKRERAIQLLGGISMEAYDNLKKMMEEDNAESCRTVK